MERSGGARLQPAAQHMAVDLAKALIGVAAELDAVPLDHLHAELLGVRLWGGGCGLVVNVSLGTGVRVRGSSALLVLTGMRVGDRPGVS